MKNWKHILPLVVLILFEFMIGVLMFVKPEEFIRTVIMIFGFILFVFGLVYLIQFFSERRENGAKKRELLVLAIFVIAFGVFCAAGSGFIVKLFAVPAVLYGIFLVIAGVFKGRTFFVMRSEGTKASFILFVSALLAIALGCLLILHPFDSVVVLWRITGLSWILGGIGDAISLILGAKQQVVVTE